MPHIERRIKTANGHNQSLRAVDAFFALGDTDALNRSNILNRNSFLSGSMNIQFAASTILVFSGAALLLTSCSSGNSGVTYEDFRSRASALAGGNAIDCGNAEIGQGNEQNTCVGSAYVSQSAAFATYDNQGTDSRSATGLAVTEDSRVYRLFFDGDPSGGGSSSNGDISVLECTNASLSGIVDGQPTELFNCD